MNYESRKLNHSLPFPLMAFPVVTDDQFGGDFSL